MLITIKLIAILTVLLVVALGHEQRNRALKHRAGTQHLLAYIAWLPVEAVLDRNQAE